MTTDRSKCAIYKEYNPVEMATVILFYAGTRTYVYIRQDIEELYSATASTNDIRRTIELHFWTIFTEITDFDSA